MLMITILKSPSSQGITRNIFKNDIRRLSNTDDKRNQIRWFKTKFPSTPLHAGI